MTTANRIINLLNRQAMTINELAVELGISRNSAHQQVTKLEAAGALAKETQPLSGAAGKPAYRYQVTAGNEDLFSTAYKPLIDALMQTISDDLPEKSRLKLLEKAGRALATASGLTPTNDVGKDVEESVNAVNSLGAMAEFTNEKGCSQISCHSCPVASLVHNEPLTCCMVAAFFSEATGKKVTVQCRKDDTVVCGFSVEH